MVKKLLYSLEQMLKLDMTYVTKGSFWTSIRFGVSTLASLLAMIAFGNLLSKDTYGTYNYLLSLGASLSFLTLSGTSVAVLRAVSRGVENIVPSALSLQLKYNLIASAIIFSGGAYYGYKGNILFAVSLVLLAAAYPFAEAFHIYEQILVGKKRFDVLTYITSSITLISTGATVITLLITSNVLILICIYSLTSLIPNIIAYFIVTKNLDKSSPTSEDIKEMRRTSFHITGAGIIGTLGAYIDKIVLFQVAGPATLAIYGFAIAGPERLKGLLKNWMSIASPRLAQATLQEISSVFYKRILLSLIPGLILATIYILLAPLLFHLFLPQYLDSIKYSQVQALALIIMPATIYIGGIFAGQNMLRATYIQGVGSQVLRIIMFIIFGWLWQIWGLIIASIASQILNTIYSIVVWKKELKRLKQKNETAS